MSKSIFLVVAGSDDIANTYFDVGVRKQQYDVPAYTDLMVSSASSFLEVILIVMESSGIIHAFPFPVHIYHTILIVLFDKFKGIVRIRGAKISRRRSTSIGVSAVAEKLSGSENTWVC